MTRWKGWSASNSSTASSSSTSGEVVDNEEVDYYNRAIDTEIPSSPNTCLLFPKETSSSQPLFPVSRKHFLIMTCKRTLFACRGVFLFCGVVFVIVSLVASSSELINQSNPNGSAEGGSGNLTESNYDRSKYRVTPVELPKGFYSMVNRNYFNASFNTECGYKKSDYALIADALKKGLEFFERNVDNITVLDASLGAKIVAEQLKLTVSTHPKLPLEVQQYVERLWKLAEKLSVNITETVKGTTKNIADLAQTLPWIETKGLWELPRNGRWYKRGQLKYFEPTSGEDFEPLWKIVSRKEIIGEQESDACISQVFHCDVANITEKCHEVFLSVERSMYSLTHQVIYMLLAQKNKCYARETWYHIETLQNEGNPFLEKLCGKVWQEANSIAEANFPPRYRDLFIEQIGMCALAGYTDFLQRDWLRRIISWQSVSTSGCFGGKRRRIPTIGMLVEEYQRKQQKHNIRQSHRRHGTRRKRSDMVLEDENRDKCSVHFTSVGITALSLHLRYFFDSCLDSY
ncbi:unnamed protein product [Orchesella dallaii]|uniref:Angiotensin-converting enzyme n=1 Tax=Orchesella dallaii TaxID=48710 RepID=A0ABP1RBC5_9HEXA